MHFNRKMCRIDEVNQGACSITHCESRREAQEGSAGGQHHPLCSSRSIQPDWCYTPNILQLELRNSLTQPTPTQSVGDTQHAYWCAATTCMRCLAAYCSFLHAPIGMHMQCGSTLVMVTTSSHRSQEDMPVAAAQVLLPGALLYTQQNTQQVHVPSPRGVWHEAYLQQPLHTATTGMQKRIERRHFLQCFHATACLPSQLR
jgi:hypothetical protein